MTYVTDTPAYRPNWAQRAESWLDARGKGAWIAAMVVGFIAFWPVGLALLAYMIYAGKFSGGCSSRRRAKGPGFAMHRSSGNAAFDAYRSETLRRLEEEQRAFEEFLERLREAKDKAEFDQFMDDRKRHANHNRPEDEKDGDAA